MGIREEKSGLSLVFSLREDYRQWITSEMKTKG